MTLPSPTLLAVLGVFLLASPASAGQTIVLHISSDYPRSVTQLIDEAIGAFREGHPDIEVVVEQRPAGMERLLREFFSGDRPDVLEAPAWVASGLARRGAVRPLTSDMVPLDRSGYSPDVWDACQFPVAADQPDETQPAGVPWLADTIQLIYNAKLFRKAGRDPDQPPLIFDDLPKLCAALREGIGAADDGPFPIGLAGAREDVTRCFALLLYRAGGRLMESDPDSGMWGSGITSAAGRSAREAMLSLRQFAPPDARRATRRDLIEQFASGRIVMMFGSLRDLNAVLELAPNLEARTAFAPVAEKSTSAAEISVLALPVTRSSDLERAQAAAQLLEFLGGLPVQRLVMTGGGAGRPCAVPVLRRLADDEWYSRHAVYRPFVNGLADCAPIVPSAGWKRAEERVVGEALARAFAGEADPKAALDAADSAATSILSSHYGQVGHQTATQALGMSLLAMALFVVMVLAIGHRG